MSARPCKTIGNLTIYENDGDGFSWEWKYHDEVLGERKEYGGVGVDDLLEYTYEENLPEKYEAFTEEEQELFLKEYCRIRGKLRG